MPDDELFRLAGRGELRRNLTAQVNRMLKDRRSQALVENFVGQWLQVRYLESPARPGDVGMVELCHAQDVVKVLSD